tara:strand:+ start:257 stop:607 length:351 start_codon:yes stop_codon:yes gene_type:complete
MDNFEWNDDIVCTFVKVYCGNLKSIEELYCPLDYRGKSIEEKLEQFKIDFKANKGVNIYSVKKSKGYYTENGKNKVLYEVLRYCQPVDGGLLFKNKKEALQMAKKLELSERKLKNI